LASTFVISIIIRKMVMLFCSGFLSVRLVVPIDFPMFRFKFMMMSVGLCACKGWQTAKCCERARPTSYGDFGAEEKQRKELIVSS
jgi:hypothetical protein